MILEIALVVIAAVAVGIAFYKHGSLAAVEASAQKEAAIVKAAVAAEAQKLESLASKVDAEAKTDYAAIIARLKAV